MIEIGGWACHSSEYEIITFEDLPFVAIQEFQNMMQENDDSISYDFVPQNTDELSLFAQFQLTEN